MKNALTIDLEDYHQVTAFARNNGTAATNHVSRVERNAEKTLEMLARHNCKATFFTVGSVAEEFPSLIRRVADAGHELACHSYAHRQISLLTAEQFRDDTLRAKHAIEEAAGVPVRGYRAPSFSITSASSWAFGILTELGFDYDSSIFPINHFNFRMKCAPRDPFVINTACGALVEFPMTTLQLAGARAPIAGGAYLRVLPYRYTRWGIRYLNDREGRAANVYLHPWELDPEQPRMKGTLSARMRHYFGLRGAATKFDRLLHDFDFQTLRDWSAQIQTAIGQNEGAFLRMDAATLFSLTA